MLGAHLKRLREAQGLTQTELGARLGYGQSGISNIECGRSSLGARDLARWLEATGAAEKERLEALRLAAQEMLAAESPAGNRVAPATAA